MPASPERGARGSAEPRGRGAIPTEEPALSIEPSSLFLEEADGLALGLRLSRDRLALALGRTVAIFSQRRGWTNRGYARQSDYAREVLGHTGRWMTEMTRLGVAVERHPRLASALTGQDGGIPLGVAAVLQIAAVADAESELPPESRQASETSDWLENWIDRARNFSLRQLKADAAAARKDARQEDPTLERGPLSFGPGEAAETLQELQRHTVFLAAPPEVAAAFEEALDLHRAVCGGNASVASFIEALVAEHRAGPDRIDRDGEEADEQLWTKHWRQGGEPASVREARLAEECGHWRQWPRDGAAVEGRIAEHEQARALLAEIDALVRQAAEGAGPETATGGKPRFHPCAGSAEMSDAALDRRIRQLLGTDRRIEIALGKLLASMVDRMAWRRWHPAPWRFADVGHYAEERLGISRTRAWQLVRVARRLRHFPHLRRAYQGGRASLEAVLLVLQVLGKGPAEEETELLWTERACRSTVKRLRDEIRELKRRRVDRPEGAPPPAPLTDDAWFRTVARPPGRSYRRVQKLWKRAEHTHAHRRFLRRTLYFYLDEELVGDFRTALIDAAQQATGSPHFPDLDPARSVQRSSASEGSRWGGSIPEGVAAPVQTFSASEGSGKGRPQLWRGLLALLMDYCATWDPPDVPRAITPRRRSEAIYVRDGYRCTAPGCTSRRNLEDHHIQYRSRGGGNDPSNRTTLCRYHHLLGEHGGLMQVTGQAPTGLDFSLGRRGAGPESFRNELRNPTAEP